MRFQAVCSKGNKKLILNLSAENKDIARTILHKQGYSIISLEETTQENLSEDTKNEGFFYFDTYTNGVLQKGKIQSNDIFKAYRKLTEDLGYDVRYIYSDENMSEEQKKMISAKVKDTYVLYLQSQGIRFKKKPKESLTIDEQELQGLSSGVTTEITKYVKLTEDTIIKIENLITKYHDTISESQITSLKNISLELSQLKGVRNFSKIQLTLEETLKKVGTIELELLKKGMVNERKSFLQETNRLLKEVGSGEKIVSEEEKQKSLQYRAGNFFSKIFHLGKETIQTNVQKQENKNNIIDTKSFIYFKNKRELDIYKKTLEKNQKQILKALFTLNFKDLKRYILKNKLLSQNIQIIDNRLHNRNISYTKIVYGLKYYLQQLFVFIENIATFFVIVLFLYCLFYIALTTGANIGLIQATFVQKSILFVTLFSFFVFCLLYIRSWKTGILFFCCIVGFSSFLFFNF